jgi:hypothetical protein
MVEITELAAKAIQKAVKDNGASPAVRLYVAGVG